MERPTSNGQEGAQAARHLAASALETLFVNHPSPGISAESAAPSTTHQTPPLGLYIHVPFCSAICNYCNFNRGLFDEAVKGRYVKALIEEIRHEALNPDSSASADRPNGAAGDATAADTIYFGGGTPSLLEPDEVHAVIETCRDVFDVAEDREVTIEANPESVTEERLREYRAAGVNRISFGVQSFREEELRRLSRLHSADRARTAFAEARRAGFENISLDLMMWLPAQRIEEWLESIDMAPMLAPEHLSLYLLEVYPNAPLKDDMARARWSQAPDEDAAMMYVQAMERLEVAGYEQYEISNVARSGRQSRHNVKYWSDGQWLGFGCGAHSTLNGVRWKNLSATEDYIDRVSRGMSAATDIRRLSPAERLGDALFMGLRLTAGVSLDVFRSRYGVDVWGRYGEQLAPFMQAGYLQKEGDRLWLTRRGMLLANEVMAVFV